MRCRFCGSTIDDDSIYCSVCGEKVKDQRVVHRERTFSKQSCGRRNWVIPIAAVCSLVVLFGVVFLGVLLYNNYQTQQKIDSAVALVQNGNLGEFTDVTVYNLLGIYRGRYETETWNGGMTDRGERITEVKFSSPQASGSAMIQFKLLTDKVFQVSAFVDTDMPKAKSSEIVFMLTSLYYSEAILEYLEDDVKIAQLNALMRSVDASEVLYGASDDFTGNRATLYQLANDSLMGMSAAELMEYYGLPLVDIPGFDFVEDTQPTSAPTGIPATRKSEVQYMYYMADDLLADLEQNVMRANKNYTDQYINLTGKLADFSYNGVTFYIGSTTNDYSHTISCSIETEKQMEALLDANIGDSITILCKVTQIDQQTGYRVETISIENIIPDTNTQQKYTPPTSTPNTVVGSVLMSSGGLKVRSGPGTNYEEVRRLEPGATVTIYEQTLVNGVPWGNIGDGWVCMSYVDTGAQQSNSASGTATSVNMTVCVKFSAGELKIRSGPDSSYSEVGRLYGGEMLTVTQLQQTGSRQWGRITQGWICMDYVDTVYETQNERNNAQRFIGNWEDQNSQRCHMTIEPFEYGSLVIDISWGNSAFSTSMWRAVGEYDAATDSIQYHDCDHWEAVSDGNGNFTNNYYYTGGQGTFYFSGGNLLWQENNESTGSRCSFVKVG